MPVLSLRSIAATNFRGVKSRVELSFADYNPGLYYVRGINQTVRKPESNGSGKSTLFVEALLWALSNKISRSNRPGELIENWDAEGDKTVVEVRFTLDGEEHLICRTRNPNGLDLDGRRVEQRDIEELLPLTESTLRHSILIDQFGDMFLSLKPEEKSRIFSDTLDLDVWLAAADKAGKELSAKQRLAEQADRKLAVIEGSLAESQDAFDIAQKNENEFEAKVNAELKTARAARRSSEATAQKARRVLDDARDALARLGALDKQDRALEDARTARKRKQRELSTAQGKVTAVSRDIDRAERRLASYTDKTEVCPECGQKVTNTHVAKHRADAKKEIAELQAERKKLGLVEGMIWRELGAIDNDIRDREKALTEYTKGLDAVAAAAEISLAADHAFNAIKARIEDLKTRENPYERQCNELESRIASLRVERRQQKKEVSRIMRETEIYKFWQRGFREIRLEQIDTTLAELEFAANRHVESLGLEGWEIGFATERETKAGTVSHGFSVFLYPPDRKEPVPWEAYSGGEMQRWQLATTFGLAEVLLGRSGITTDFEVYDEPSTHMSPEGIDDLLVCLRQRAAETRRRIFLVDHNSLERGAFDGIVTVIRDADGIRIE